MHPLPLIKSQVFLFTVMRVEEMLMPKSSGAADPGEASQASAGWAARNLDTRHSVPVLGGKGHHPSKHRPLFPHSHPGNTAGNVHGYIDHKALPDERGPLACPSPVAEYTFSWSL